MARGVPRRQSRNGFESRACLLHTSCLQGSLPQEQSSVRITRLSLQHLFCPCKSAGDIAECERQTSREELELGQRGRPGVKTLQCLAGWYKLLILGIG